MSLQIQAERLTRTIVLILTYVNFILSPFDWRKKFAYRNKIYLISISQTSSESVNIVDEFLIFTFFSVFIIVKI